MIKQERKIFSNLLNYAERQTCRHEETYSYWNLWEICSACEARWAKDEGGKPEFEFPKEIVAAQELLAR